MSRRFAAKRLETVPKSTVWNEFTPLAMKHNSINLGQGFPSLSPEKFVTDAAIAALSDPNPLSQQYCRPLGHPALVSVLQKRYSDLLKRPVADDGTGGVAMDEILVTNGTTQALNIAFEATVSPGDEIIVIEPSFDLYTNDIQMAGGIVKFVQMKPSNLKANDWEIDWEGMRAKIGPKTKGILFNTPQNVPGKVWSRDEIQTLASLAIEKDLLVYADEVYDRLVFDGCEHISIASLPGMWERTITMASAGKTLTVTGWKIGWAIAPSDLIAELAKTHAHQCFSVATPLQVAVGNALSLAAQNDYFSRFVSQYKTLRDLLCNVLREAGLPPIEPQGSFFVLADISGVKEEAYGYDEKAPVCKDWQFCRWLTTEIGVTAIPVTAFCSEVARPSMEKYIRFAFCKPEEQILQAAERLKKLKPFMK